MLLPSRYNVVTVEPHDPTNRPSCKWYLSHHPVVNPGQGFLMKLLSFNAHPYCWLQICSKNLTLYFEISSTQIRHIRGCRWNVLPGRSSRPQSIFALFFFVKGDIHFRSGSSPVHSLYNRSTGFAYTHQLRTEKKQQMIICPHTLRPLQS